MGRSRLSNCGHASWHRWYIAHTVLGAKLEGRSYRDHASKTSLCRCGKRNWDVRLIKSSNYWHRREHGLLHVWLLWYETQNLWSWLHEHAKGSIRYKKFLWSTYNGRDCSHVRLWHSFCVSTTWRDANCLGVQRDCRQCQQWDLTNWQWWNYSATWGKVWPYTI